MKYFNAHLGNRKVKELSIQSPAVTFATVGEWITGKYEGYTEALMKDGKMARFHQLELVANGGATFTIKDEAKVVNAGERCSISGFIADKSLNAVLAGSLVGIEYLGTGEAKKGRNATKLLRIVLIEAPTAAAVAA